MKTPSTLHGRRIILSIMLPVVLTGLAMAGLLNYFLADPLISYLQQRTDNRLRLTSKLALAVCDDLMQDMLDGRLENDPATEASMKREALAQLAKYQDKFLGLEMLVVDDQGRVLSSSLALPPGFLGQALLTHDEEVHQGELDSHTVRFHSRYFPLWRWHLVSLLTADDYLAPSRMASRAVYLATFGVLLSVVASLLLVFQRQVNRPLRQMLQATHEIAAGGFPRLEIKTNDELGMVARSFDAMTESLRRGQNRIQQVMEQLSKSEEVYRLLTERSLALITIVQDGRLVYANDRTLELAGYTREELTGRPLREVIHPDDLPMISQRVQEHQEGNWENNHYEFRYLTKDGQVRWLEILASPFTYKQRPAILGHSIDVTDKKMALEEQQKLETKLQHAQRMEVVGTLAGGISHDFNNLLQAITGYAQLLHMRKGQDEGERSYVEGILRSSQRGAELINQLLAFSRRAESRLKTLDMNQEVLHVCQVLSRTIPRMVSIQTILSPSLQAILADPTQLEQVMMNLGSNAKDAMPQGGKLTFQTRNVHLDTKYCQGLDIDEGAYVQLRVTDTGVGMDRQTRDQIFDPFFTTKPLGEGTGLGLSTVYGIVKAHHGHITCYSEQGQGTTFNIYLPAAAGLPEAQQEQAQGLQPLAGGQETILLVDDEESLLEIAQEMLETLGYRVMRASSGEQALEIYQAHPGGIDLVLMDLGMPGMGGRACLEQLIQVDPGAKVIISTGYVGRGQEDEARQAGAAGFLAKPYHLGDLAAQIRQVLESRVDAC